MIIGKESGVTPHIEVQEEQALNVAHYLILKKLIDKSPDVDIMGNRWKHLADDLEQELIAGGINLEDLSNQTIGK